MVISPRLIRTFSGQDKSPAALGYRLPRAFPNVV
jgi:hypothetical protein